MNIKTPHKPTLGKTKIPHNPNLSKSIQDTMDRINVFMLGDAPKLDIDTVSSGSLGLDIALGIGGFPIGRIVEISGPESSGKTTIALHVIAEAQKAGNVCAFVDVEHALDPEYAERLGVDTTRLIFAQPDSAEHALSIVDELARTGDVRVIVLDSVAALVPRAELEGEMGDQQMGLQARLMGQALRKLTGVVSKANCMVVFINQLRQKIGVVFGNPDVTPGGLALRFYSSVRVDVRKVTSIKDAAGNLVGNHVKAKITKNKVAPPFKSAEFDIMYGEGISRHGEAIDMATNLKVIKKSGAWYLIGQNKVQGKESALKLFASNPNLAQLVVDYMIKYSKSPDDVILKELSDKIDSLGALKIETHTVSDDTVETTYAESMATDSDTSDEDR